MNNYFGQDQIGMSGWKCSSCLHPLNSQLDECPNPYCMGKVDIPYGTVSKMAEWRPIETAPKDGTFVDLWVSDKEWLYRIADAYFGCPEDWQDYDGDTPCWMMEDFVMDGMAYVPIRGIPTHWMPLPEPPK